MLCIPALFFCNSLIFKILFFLYFYFFAWFQGKRNSLPITLITIVSIVFFNLLVPYGKVLRRIGSIAITEGALKTGLEKAITLEALIMMSKATIRSDLHLPGVFGKLIAESFRIFEVLLAKKKQFSWQKPVENIDRLLLELSETESTPDGTLETAGRGSRHIVGRSILFAQTVLIWIFWILMG